MDLLMAISAEEKRCSFKLTLYPARSAAWLAMLACVRDGRGCGRQGLSGKSNLEECPSRKWKMENGKCVPLRSDSEESAELRIIAE